jgi:dihydroorotate dehydrogenase
MYRLLIRKFLFLFDAEKVHHFTFTFLKGIFKIPRIVSFVRNRHIIENKKLERNLFGLTFKNPVGLAAGFDKNAVLFDELSNFGFGFIEIGTVTPRPQTGNPPPRLFRLPQSEAIINRMGFNNKGVDYLIEQVKQAKFTGVLGINIGKNIDTAVENAVDDYLICLDKVYAHASYITVNISSPNTPGLRSLQYGDELRNLLSALKQRQAELADQYQRYVPITIKIAPDLDTNEIESMAAVFLEQKIDALIATNTILARDAVQGQTHAQEQGGLSGKPVTQKSTQVIQQFSQFFKEDIPIIGVGGISSTSDAQDKLDAGACLVQIYTGFVYQGADLIQQCLQSNKHP